MKKSNWFNKQNKNSTYTACILADFFAVVTQLTLSNLIGMHMAMQSSVQPKIVARDCRDFDFVKNTHAEAQKI